MKISVIIPVYNTPENYLKRCLKSIMDNTASKTEIIVVDDGSDENYIPEYKHLVEKTECAMIIRQDNKGVSAARNRGIAEASGDYIAFVDADDEVENHFIDHALDIALRQNADIVIGAIDFYGNDMIQKISREYIFDGAETVNAEKAMLDGDEIIITGSSCGRIYRTSLARKVMFDEGIRFSEDQIFNIEILSRADKIILEPEKWYLYYDNDFSAMNKARSQDYVELCRPFMNRLYEIIIDKEYDNIHDDLGVFGLNMVYNIFYSIYDQKLSKCQEKNREAALYESRLVRYIKSDHMSLKNKDIKIRVKLSALIHNKIKAVYLLRDELIFWRINKSDRNYYT